jgi:hypothetical protein
MEISTENTAAMQLVVYNQSSGGGLTGLTGTGTDKRSADAFGSKGGGGGGRDVGVLAYGLGGGGREEPPGVGGGGRGVDIPVGVGGGRPFKGLGGGGRPFV